MTQINYVSKEGFEKLNKDLYEMKFVQRPFISKQIADARDKGDLSENAEYHAAKKKQSSVESRIKYLEFYSKNPQVIESFRAPIYEDKVIDFILTKATVTDKEVSIDDLTAEDDEAGDTKPKKKAAKKKAE